MLLLVATLSLLWVIYNKLYLPYIDCQVNLNTIHDVKLHTLPNPIGKRAIVIGGSFAGLSTASILSKYFSEVIIVERSNINEDEEVSVAQQRQGEQPHLICHRSFLIWDKLFPEFLKEMTEVLQKNRLSQIAWPSSELRFNLRVQKFQIQVERLLRRRVKELPNVKFYYGYSVDDHCHTFLWATARRPPVFDEE